MAHLMPLPRLRFFDSNGDPLSGGKLYTYAAGTSTLLATYTDQTEVVQNANPVILDSNGEASVWIGASSYKFVLKTSADVTIWTVDAAQHIGNGEIIEAKLADGAVTTDKIGASAVTSSKIADNAVDTSELAASAVTTAKIANLAVEAEKIQNNAVTTAKIADSAVTYAKMADRAVTTNGTDPGAGGISQSAAIADVNSSGTKSLASVTLTTTGRPVWVGFAATGSSSYVLLYNSGGGNATGDWYIKRSSTTKARATVRAYDSGTIQPIQSLSCFTIDDVAAGSYTWDAESVLSGGTEVQTQGYRLVAYEL